MTVELRVLGSLRLSAADGRDLESLLRQPKRTALLAYLAAAVPRGFQRRDTLLSLFWPELDDAHARAALNQALYVLRNALGEQAIVTRGDGEVGLGGDVVWCDAAAFDAALDDGHSAEALALYSGDLLEGFFVGDAPGFERWVDAERGRLRRRASEGAWSLAESRAADGDAVEASRWATRAADLQPADEAVARRLITFLHRLGDRAAALRAYEAYAWQLKKEYELEPSAETQALALALKEEGRQPAEVRVVKVAPAPFRGIVVAVQRRIPLGWMAASLVAVTGLAAGARAWFRGPETPESDPVARFALEIPGAKVLAGGVPGSTIALSPDGRRVAYLAEQGRGNQLFMRAMDRLESVPMPHTRGAYLPFFSPDGAWLGFVAEGSVRKVSLDGGPAIIVCAVESSVYGASWGLGDVIVFATPSGLWRVPAGGGAARVLAVPDTARGVVYRWPEVLPAGRAAVLTRVDRDGFELVAVSLATGSVRPLDQEGTSPRFVSPGYLVFARADGALLAAPFDEAALALTGPPIPLAEGVIVGTHGAAKVGVSRAGALAYLAEQTADRALVAVDRAGRAESLPLPPQRFHSARFSPDGRRIVTDVANPGGSPKDIWILDLERRTSRRVTFGNDGLYPQWTPDGERIAFATASGGRETGFAIRQVSVDGRDSAETLLSAQGEGQTPLGFTPDGRALVFQRADRGAERDIWILLLDGERRPRTYLRTPFDERGAALSPDGRWLAYLSNESGRDEVYVRAFPEPGDAARISENGGREPLWAPSGRELFYRSDSGMVAAAVAAGSPITVARREILFDDRPYVAITGGRGYDVHPDGRRFLMVRRGSEGHEVVVVLNWFDHLRAGSR